MKFLPAAKKIAFACALVVVSAPSLGQATRTWVSGVGDDVNPCSRTAPCKTFAGAISKTAAAGEINTLDPGGFGAVTITKSITIGTDPSMGGILSASTNGVIINAATTDRINLRGLTIQGAGNGLNGIRVLQAGQVNIDGATVTGTLGYGIEVSNAAGSVQVNVSNTTFTNNGTSDTAGGAIRVQPTGSGSANVSLSHVRMFANTWGLQAVGTSTGQINVSVDNLTASGNRKPAIAANSSGGNSPLNVTVDRSTLSNGFAGVNANGVNTTVRLSNSVVTGNSNGLLIFNGGQLISYGNNVLDGNGADGTPTMTAPLR